MQALKSFMGGQGTSSGSEKDQTSQMLTMAVQEAEKLFNQSGGSSSGSKQDVVNSAAMTVSAGIMCHFYEGAYLMSRM